MPSRLTIPPPIYLSLATMKFFSSINALELAKKGSIDWNPPLRKKAEELEAALARLDAGESFTSAARKEALAQMEAFMRGMNAYLKAPPPAIAGEENPAIWREGSSTIFDYGRNAEAPIILFIPSLINKSYILDLLPERSLMGFLREKRHHCMLIDWGEPGENEADYGIEDYIYRLQRALEKITKTSGKKVILAGYCMGGLMAMALQQLQKSDIAGLVLLATPWDFHADDVERPPLDENAISRLDEMIKNCKTIPGEVIHNIFYWLHPWSVYDKFRKFSSAHETGGEFKIQVAREYWLNDNIPLTSKAALDCFIGWGCHNTPMKGRWKIGDMAIRPENINCPTFIAIPKHDQIVPPLSVQPLIKSIKGNESVSCPSGHIGMIVGKNAKKGLWLPLEKWLGSL